MCSKRLKTARAAKRGQTGEVISELARTALTAPPPLGARQRQRLTTGSVRFPKRGGIVTNELIDKLREDDAY